MVKYDYVRNYLDLQYYSNIYSKERSELHDTIIQKYFYDDNIKKKSHGKNKLIFTSGAYGCGKSHVLKLLDKHNKINLKKYIFIDPDKLRSELPEYEQLIKLNPWMAGFETNQEVFYIGELIRFHAMFEGYDVIYDSSLRNWSWMSQHIEWIKETFPKAEIIIIHIETDWTNVLERNLLRSEQTKRCIPLENIKQAYLQSIESNKILSKLVNLNIIIKNNLNEETEKFILESVFNI